MKLRYVLHRSGTWHAWAPRGTRSMCGTVTVDDLRVTPAKTIADALPERAVLCGSCQRRLGGAAPAAPANLDESARGWLGFLRRHLARAQVALSRADEVALAERLALIGSPKNREAVAAFDLLRGLLLTPRTNRRAGGRITQKVTHLHQALLALPATAEAVSHVVASLRAWRKVTGRSIDATTRFRPDTVVASMLEVPAPEAYIRHLHSSGLSDLAVIFHPNTLARRKRDASLRGVFGGTGEYWDRTAEQLNHQVVSDEEVA